MRVPPLYSSRGCRIACGGEQCRPPTRGCRPQRTCRARSFLQSPFCVSFYGPYRSILSVGSGLRATVRAATSCFCCSRAKHPRRASRPGREEEQTPRHDLSETESEEDENPCQADAIGWKEGSQIKRLCKERCNDAACGWVRLMGEDANQSSSNELSWDGLQASCQLCARHKESYELSKARRACSVEGCEKAAQTLRGGVRLCRFHASKEEKPTAPRNTSGSGRTRATGPAEPEPKRASSRGTDRAPPHSQEATLDTGIEMPAVEDRVLQGLTWEEIASIPDEDLRRRAVSLKKAVPTNDDNRPPSGTQEPPTEPALYAYLDSRMRGSSHAAALSQAATGRWGYLEGARKLKEAARKHWSQLPSNSPPSIRQYVWELAQSGAERSVSGEGVGWGLEEPQLPCGDRLIQRAREGCWRVRPTCGPFRAQVRPPRVRWLGTKEL